MSKENAPKIFARPPNTWGIRAASRLDDRISTVHNRLGFDPARPWGLFSLETFEGKMGHISNFVPRLQKVISQQAYRDRKTLIWAWPLPGDYAASDPAEVPGVLRMIYLPRAAAKPTDLVSLELVDVHSQLLGRIGFEFLRLEELLSVWKVTAGGRQYIGAASMSRNLIEAGSALYALAGSLAKQWSKCKTTSGRIHATSTGGRVDRERALEVDKLRKLLWKSRNELLLHDFKKTGLDASIAEWRHPELVRQLELLNIKVRREVTTEPNEGLVQLVRDIDRRITLTNTLTSFKKDYELLCNVVHPSMGSFQLFSGSPVTDQTHSFHHITVGKNRGRSKNQSGDPALGQALSAYGIFGNAISESMFIAVSVYISILEFMTAIGDDISLTANIESLSLHKTWRYPKALKGIDCLCTWKEVGGCDHSWGSQGPQIPNDFNVDMNLLPKGS